MAAKIKKDDKVIVLTGKDKGRTGEVMKAFPDENRVVVDGHQHPCPPHQAEPGRPARRHQAQGSADPRFQRGPRRPEDGKATRVGFKIEGRRQGPQGALRQALRGEDRCLSKKYTPRLKTLYDEAIRAKLNEQFSYTNEMQIPRSTRS